MALLILVPSLTLSTAGAAGVTRTVRTTGLAPVEGGDRAAARVAARRAALRAAVEEGVGVLVSSATRVENFSVIADHILTETSGYVQRYTTVTESVEEGLCRVVVEAVVDLHDLHRDLAALRLALAESGSPRVICRGREWLGGTAEAEAEDGGEVAVGGVLQAELARAVRRGSGDSFQVILPPTPGGGDPADGTAALLVDGEARLGRATVPVPFSTANLDQKGLHAATASVEIRIGWSDRSEAAATLTSTGRSAAPTWRLAAAGAVRRAVEATSEGLAAALAAEVRAQAYSRRQLLLRVRAPHHLLAAFEDELPRRISAIDALRRRAYVHGQGVYDLDGRAAGFELARSLSARGLEAAEVEILRATTNSLFLALSPRAAPPP